MQRNGFESLRKGDTMNTQTILSEEELAPLLERKRQLQANLASQNSCSSGGCSSRASVAPSPGIEKPNVLKALLIAVSVLAVSALAWWGVTG